jgi:hypothetical protein
LTLGRLYVSQADFSLENPYWNGLSHISGANVRPLYSIADLANVGAADTLLVVSPQKDYTVDESHQVALFLQSGGKVVVMDDFGRADSLLQNLSSPITIDLVPLAEYENFYVNYSFPVVTSFNPSKETANVTKLIFNHPAPLDVASAAYSIAYTSDKAWLDLNDNGKLDGAEHMGIYSVAARSEYGSGELFVIGDPDLLINGMAEMGDNRLFISNLLSGTVWVDVSHGRDVTPLGALYYTIKYDPISQAAIVLLAILCGILFLRRGDLAELLGRRSKGG